MNKKSCLILLILNLLPVRGLTQWIFNYGPELGITIPYIPKIHSYTEKFPWIPNSIYHNHIKDIPVISPLFGLGGQLKFSKHFQITFGLQYQMTGFRYNKKTTVENTDPRYYNQYTIISEYDNTTFHKICSPLLAEYLFRPKKNMQPSIVIGLRQNFLFYGKGRYEYNTSNYTRPNPSPTYVELIKHNYIPIEAMLTNEKFPRQIVIGFSCLVRQSFKINFHYNIGKEVTYSQNPSPWHSGRLFRNNDILISASYYFNQANNKGKSQ
jgi:hypothetical protein